MADIFDEATATVNNEIARQIDRLTTKYGIAAQVFFAKVRDGVFWRDLEIAEYLEREISPLEEELESWKGL